MTSQEPKYIYVEVTQDKYELPIRVADSITELAELMGITANNVSSILSKQKRGILKKNRIVKVLNDPNGVDHNYKSVRYQIYKDDEPIGKPMRMTDVCIILHTNQPMVNKVIRENDGVFKAYRIERVIIDE